MTGAGKATLLRLRVRLDEVVVAGWFGAACAVWQCSTCLPRRDLGRRDAQISQNSQRVRAVRARSNRERCRPEARRRRGLDPAVVNRYRATGPQVRVIRELLDLEYRRAAPVDRRENVYPVLTRLPREGSGKQLA
jgi:hypothetical protein